MHKVLVWRRKLRMGKTGKWVQSNLETTGSKGEVLTRKEVFEEV